MAALRTRVTRTRISCSPGYAVTGAALPLDCDRETKRAHDLARVKGVQHRRIVNPIRFLFSTGIKRLGFLEKPSELVRIAFAVKPVVGEVFTVLRSNRVREMNHPHFSGDPSERATDATV